MSVKNAKWHDAADLLESSGFCAQASVLRMAAAFDSIAIDEDQDFRSIKFFGNTKFHYANCIGLLESVLDGLKEINGETQ